MEDRVNPITHCTHCRTELSYDEKRKCKICRVCHPAKDFIPIPEKSRERYLDVPFTPEQEVRIRKIVVDELEDWHVPKPPVTASEVVEELKEVNWRQQAKDLGIELYHKKKEDVLVEIKEKTNGGSSDIEDKFESDGTG